MFPHILLLPLFPPPPPTTNLDDDDFADSDDDDNCDDDDDDDADDYKELDNVQVSIHILLLPHLPPTHLPATVSYNSLASG